MFLSVISFINWVCFVFIINSILNVIVKIMDILFKLDWKFKIKININIIVRGC